MDPSGMGTCAQVQHSLDKSKPQHLPFPFALHDSPPETSTPRTKDSDTVTGPDCGLQALETDFRAEKAEELAKKTKESTGWRKVIRNFTPS